MRPGTHGDQAVGTMRCCQMTDLSLLICFISLKTTGLVPNFWTLSFAHNSLENKPIWIIFYLPIVECKTYKTNLASIALGINFNCLGKIAIANCY